MHCLRESVSAPSPGVYGFKISPLNTLGFMYKDLFTYNFYPALYENISATSKKFYFMLCGCASNADTGGFGPAFIVPHIIAHYVVCRITSGLPFFTVGDKIICKILMDK